MNIGKNFIVFTLASLLLKSELRDILNSRQSRCIGLAQSTPSACTSSRYCKAVKSPEVFPQACLPTLTCRLVRMSVHTSVAEERPFNMGR